MKRILLKVLKYLSILIALTLLMMVLLYFAVLGGIFGKLPEESVLRGITNEEASLIYSSDNQLIGKIFAENRTEIGEVPDFLKQALISTEDKRFFEHKGYDTRSYLRVLIKTILLGQESSGGGSTLSQQLAKNLFGRPYHGILSVPVTKIREAIVATRLEKIYNKEEILLLYINSVPFGENTYGVEAAASRYFNKSAVKLTIEQAALLVGLLKANTAYNPRLHPEAALVRRNTVLTLMAAEGHINEVESDSLKALPLKMDYTNYEIDNPTGYFVYQVKKQARDILNEIRNEKGDPFDIEKDGLRIITTLDYRLQEMALISVKRQLSQKQKILDKELEQSHARQKWEKENGERLFDPASDSLKFRAVFSWDESQPEMTEADSLWHYHSMLHASVLMLESSSGKIRVWVGGNNFRYLPYDLVLARRQAASAFKPIVYSAALEQGFEPCDLIRNEWKEHENYPGWKPQNYDLTSGGKVPLWYALSRSLNIPSVNLYLRMDLEELRMHSQLMGLSVPDEEQPSLALGSEEVSLQYLVLAYSAFANYGDIPEPVMIETIYDGGGKPIYSYSEPVLKKVMSGGVSGAMNKMLVNAVKEGTGKALKTIYGVDAEIAGKTGTSQDYSDAWFISYTEDMVCGVWVGAMSPAIHFRTGANGSGSTLALPIAGMMINEMEGSVEFSDHYLTDFNPAVIDSAYFECDTVFISSGFQNFIDKLFKKHKPDDDSKEVNDEVAQKDTTKKEGKVKSWFKRIFGGKKDRQ